MELNLLQKVLPTIYLLLILFSNGIAGTADVIESQQILNQLGFNAGPSDGIIGVRTRSAISSYYKKIGKAFEGKFNRAVLTDLRHSLNGAPLSLEMRAKNLGITLSGHFIDTTLQDSNRKYRLPSNQWFGANINSDKAIFYKSGQAFGDWDGDGNLDYLGFGIGHRCGTGGTGGTYTTVSGRQGCKEDNATYNPMIPFSVDSTFHYFKMDNTKVMDFGTSDDWGYAATIQRMIVEDFNGDGIDDFFVPNASVQIRNGKHSYESVNNILISNGPKSWVQGYHTGFLTNLKHKTYMGFSHGADAGDIDNDGDIDVLTSHFKGVVCHFNDGKGNFESVLCNKQSGLSITVGDYNNDGNLDVITSHNFYNPKYAKFSPEKWSSKQNEKTVLLYGNGKGKFKKAQELKPAMDGKFVFSTVAEMTSFDFDNDGDVDILISAVGPFYSASAWIVYENISGKLKIADTNVVLAPLQEWQDPKTWGSMVKDEYSHPWNTYCNESILIDVNNDGLMDALCSAMRQDTRSANLFLLNKGNMQFELVRPDEVTQWVSWKN